ncbi:LysR family transcriptional regulator [Variovorax sp. J2P1-59]|uniref:LysR family transcriptional regulator n=1 Tax=Variovorax flavidus TaxID=3053501 RepID=UPI00257921C4|nr:LysR family transcriptional regulator [Variovorax sp. J2P1-59]MDM0074803.1 LysR family transcriptional regulator [Variovorax sp. J2P1-59]
MIDRNDLNLVLSVRNHGRIAAAAEHLGVTAAAVTKRLAAIEKRLGVKLFHRTTRRMSPSDEGELCVALAAELLERFEDLEAQVTARSQRPTGQIRLVANAGFGRVHLAPQIAAFHAAYPEISVELHLSNLLPDLLAEGFDAAIWLWEPTSTQWVVSKLAPNHRLVVAAPSYLKRHGHPQTPDDLSHHECIAMAQRDVFDRMWRLQRLDRRGGRDRVIEVKISGSLRSNSGEIVRDWAVSGSGIALRPLWDVTDLLRSGKLVNVLPNYAQLESDVQWIAPFRSHLPRRVTLLRQWLQDAFATPSWGD